jgi:hypothetical protein
MAERTDDASEAGRALVARRWGNQAVVRAAAVVLERASELPDTTRAQLHEATGPPGGEGSRDQD